MALTDAQDNAVIYYSENVAPILLTGTVVKGDAVGYSGGYTRAQGTTGTAIHMRCTSLEDGVSGQTIKASFGNCIVGGTRFTLGTAENSVYVAEGTLYGQFTDSAPADSGDINTKIGITIDSATILLYPQVNTNSTA